MIRGYVAVVAGDSSSADILPGSASCKRTAVKLATADEDSFEFYISIKGTDYSFKVIENVRTVDKHNIASGRLRIGFIVPNLDIVVSGNPEELEAFVYTLVAVKDPRVLPPMCFDSRDHAFKILYTWKTRIYITDPVMRVNSITVNSYPYLNEIDASSSDLVDIPESLGSLPCLTALNLSDNRLGQTKNWNCLNSPFLRENLCELRLNGNELHSIPGPISGLRNLKILDLSGNRLTELRTRLRSLEILRELYISENKLVILAGWMYHKERFPKLDIARNEFKRARDMFDIVKPQLQRNEFQNVTVPSLFKTVATYIIANSLAFWEYNIPTMITKDLEAAYICRCGSVVFSDTNGPVVQCWIDAMALAESYDSILLPIAIRCCSYECYNLIEPFFMDGNEVWL